MNYDFLQNYNIPINRQSNNKQQYNQYAGGSNSTMEGAHGSYSMNSNESIPSVNTAYYGYGGSNAYENNFQSSTGISAGYYQNPERFIPPSKHNTGYMPQKPIYKRKNNTPGGGSAAKKEPPIPEVTNDGKLAMFLGRDESYPDELNSLIHPLSCDLCNTKMNSRLLAKDHYESKAHDKHISAWLFKNYTEKGENPPSVKRFIKQGSTGPDAYYCEHCDLKLTSLTHANQHYAGKKHRLVIAQRTKPSGAGFYNSEGKWVRTGTKTVPNATKDRRFGIAESFKFIENMASNENLVSDQKSPSDATETITSAADTTTNTESEVKTQVGNLPKKSTSNANPNHDPALFCSICNISVTSAVQMTTHITGSKHMKKLKLSGLEPITTTVDNINPDPNPETLDTTPVADNVLLSAIKDEVKPNLPDLSMFRTPSGQYYCKTCNTSMPTMPVLEQHLKGKRHLKKLTEEKALASLASKKT